MTPDEIVHWLESLSPSSVVVVDEGGLTLIELLDGEPTGNYLEIGGV